MEGWSNMLYGAAVAFVVCGLLFGVGLVILANLAANTQVAANGQASRAVNNTILATAEIPNNWLTLIAVVIAAVIIIGLVLGGLAYAVGGRR